MSTPENLTVNPDDHAHDHDKDHPPSLYGVTFGSGDFVSLFSLFFDNLSTLLGFAGAILGLNPTNALLQEILYQRIDMI